MDTPLDHERDTDRIVGAALRARRVELRLTQGDLAAELGVSRQQVAKYEDGRDRLSVGRLAAAARFLGRDVGCFFDPENTVARLSKHCAVVPLEELLPSFAGEGLSVRVLFAVDREAAWPGLSIDVVTLVDRAGPRAPLPLPRALYPAMLHHGRAALLAIADAEGGLRPVTEGGGRAGASLN